MSKDAKGAVMVARLGAREAQAGILCMVANHAITTVSDSDMVVKAPV